MEKNTNGSSIEPEELSGRSVLSASLHPLYTATAELSSDPAGILYSAKYEAEGRKVLVKALSSGLSVDRSLWNDLPDEVLKLLDTVTGIHKNQLLVLEYPKASSLRRVLARQGNMQVRPAVAVTVQVLNVLRHLHERGYVFGTLNPGALFLVRTASGKLKIRIAFLGLEESALPVNLDGYRPPETEDTGCPRSGAEDLWAAAALLYEMLFGLMPFSSGVKEMGRGGAPFIPSVFSSENTWITKFLERSLHADPAVRFASADAMAAALLGENSVEVSTSEPVPSAMSNASEGSAIHDRSSIPTVPSPPSDALVQESLITEEEVTRACSLSDLQLVAIEKESETSSENSGPHEYASFLTDDEITKRRDVPTHDDSHIPEEELTTLYLSTDIIELIDEEKGDTPSLSSRNSSAYGLSISEGSAAKMYSLPSVTPAGDTEGDKPSFKRRRRRKSVLFITIAVFLTVSVFVWILPRREAAHDVSPTSADAPEAVQRAVVSPTPPSPAANISEEASIVPAPAQSERPQGQIVEESEEQDTDQRKILQADKRSENLGFLDQAIKKEKPASKKRSKPMDDLSSNPFPLKNNPFPLERSQLGESQ